MAKDNKKKLSAEDLEQASGGRIDKVTVTFSGDDPHLREIFGDQGYNGDPYSDFGYDDPYMHFGY